MTDLWWLPFLVGFVPAEAIYLYAAYHVVEGRPRHDYSRRERLKAIDWVEVVFAPAFVGVIALCVWWTVAWAMGVTP